MNYQKKVASPYTLQKCKKSCKLLLERVLGLSLADKMIVGWSLLAGASLFMQWIIFESIAHNSFHNLTGANGYLLFVLVIMLLFVTLSIHYKQKLKLHSGLHFNDYHVAIVVWILLIILPINSLIFLIGLSMFSEPSYGNGIGLCITAGILVFGGAILKKKQHNSGDVTSYMTSLPENEQVADHSARDNMKLPF